MKRVIVIGAGFAGLNAARELGGQDGVEVLVIDRRNHHLFQPLLYQVAMAGLSPAEIAAPIRALLSAHANIRVLCGEVTSVDLDARHVVTATDTHAYDYLIVACGSRHTYFGHSEWERFAPGLKTIEQATEIRRRVLTAFEEAEKESDPVRRKALLTFVVVGGGPTGVELAGAVGEMSRFTLARDFRNIDPKLTRVILVEAGPRILPMFSEGQASRAVRDLESIGCQVWTASKVTNVTAESVDIDNERVAAATTLWAAGVEAVALRTPLATATDRQGRLIVGADLSLAGHPEVFVGGDLAHVKDAGGKPLPGVAPVALQQGRFIGRTIVGELAGKPRGEFRYRDKGQMATIGRRRAIVEVGRLHFAGFFAWVVWLVVHIYYLAGFKNRIFVVMQWAWSYLTFHRGARLIVGKEWRFYDGNNTGT